MREIKFRFWDKKRKVMMYECVVSGFTVDLCHPFNIPPTTHLIPMQHTGIKDKNGKEQYYKDIKNCGGLGSFIIEYGFYDNKKSYEDNQRGYGWYLKSIKNGEVFGFAYINLHKSRVIGNIYENPELLKGE